MIRFRRRNPRVATVAGTLAAVACLVAGASAAGPLPPASAAAAEPAPVVAVPPLPAATPGGSVAWQPSGRTALGRPVLYTGSAGGAFVAWMDPQLSRPQVVPGTGDPLSSPWGGRVAPDQQPFLVAAFNGGFKFGDFNGGVISFGNSYRSPAPGEASFVVYSDGSFTVGQWGRDVDPAKQVVALRQNLGMLVDGGAPTAAASAPGNWGASVAGVATMRGAVGVDTNGALVWAGGRLSPLALAQALVSAGAVRGMELDINPEWVNFNSYDVGTDNVAHGNGIFGATGPNRYLTPNRRDFIAVFVRGTVASGATAKLGAAPLAARARVH
jgi:hypothetical protein